ncbi:serine/arginine-rich splicing factor 2-like [Camellia sinensis]|uniref:serine/arginine-rich splicing factor 2-like n=1 Tax=Camellia sinensis TaxID=4442 RepID=UPI001035F1DA|nr:serine/arginine-rich splicing factor 2-like [Camellia sinensis]
MEQARNGGWILVVSQWKGSKGQGKEAMHGLHSVFVDNIPLKMDVKSLFKLFTKFGIVKDVFIPFKRRKVSNSRFGFVRYDCYVASDIAIQKANGLLVDDKVLVVKNATFDRRSRKEHSRKTPLFIRKTQHIRIDGVANRFM